MCYKVACQQCGKYTWGGCGAHLKTLYPSIEKGKHCTCRPWPGIAIPSETATNTAATAATDTANAAATSASSGK